MAVSAVAELSEGGLLAITGNHVVDDNLDNIQASLNMAGIDTTEIDRFRALQPPTNTTTTA